MKVSLWTLNQGYQALLSLASKELRKKDLKITYWLGRYADAARPHIERWTQRDLPKLMAAHNIRRSEQGAWMQVDDSTKPATSEQIDDFNKAARAIMEEDLCALGEDHWKPFEAKDILAIEPLQRTGREEAIITGYELSLLYGWLITGEIPDDLPEIKESEK